MNADEKVERLEQFKELIFEWKNRPSTQLRSQINQEKSWIRQQVIESGCYFTITLGPPPAIGGMIMRNIDCFAMIFEKPYLQDLTPRVLDMVDQTIGILKADPPEGIATTATVKKNIRKNYAFIAMPMDEDDHDLVDVLDAIKEAAQRCEIQAERIDEPDSNDRITDRIIDSIEKAEFVIADLTKQKPNVFWEAGYAHASGKTPIYIARHGAKLDFDVKDYPVIFFKNMKQLKDSLEKRLRGLAQQ